MKKPLGWLLAAAICISLFVSVPAAAEAAENVYDADAACAYADTYALEYNEDYTSYQATDGDCANFVSQCLMAGGWETDAEWCRDSLAWINASALLEYLCRYGEKVEITEENVKDVLKPGNPVFIDDTHVGICTGYDADGMPYIDAHTSDRFHRRWFTCWNYTIDLTQLGELQAACAEGHTYDADGICMVCGAEQEPDTDGPDVINRKYAARRFWYCSDGVSDSALNLK